MTLARSTNQREHDKFKEVGSATTTQTTVYDADGNLIGSANPLPVSSVDLDIRNLSSSQDDVSITTLKPDGTNTMPSGDAAGRPVFVKLTDGTNDIDLWGSGGITAIKAVHYRIKNSKEWMSSHLFTGIADGNDAYLHINTASDIEAHGNVKIETDGKAIVYLYENPTTSDDGTSVTANNMNRGTATAADTSIYHTPTVSDDGTQLEVGLLGTAGKHTLAGSSIIGAYWYFTDNEQYLVKVTNDSGGDIDIAIQYEWHEHSC